MTEKCNTTELFAHTHESPISGSLTAHRLCLILGIISTIIACLLSFYLILRHATHYTTPTQQRPIIRILLMIPIYSITCLLSIEFPHAGVYLEATHGCYEAAVLAAFFALLCSFLIPDPSVHNLKWFFAARAEGLRWFNFVWFGVFQYVFIRVVLTIIVYITEAAGVYCESAADDKKKWASFYVRIIETISLVLAMISLLRFYVALKPLLAPHGALLKFVAIKIVIFLAFIQNLIFSYLNGHITPSDKVARVTWEFGIPNALLCIEMAGVAVLHLVAFGWRGYRAGCEAGRVEAIDVADEKVNLGGVNALKDALNPSDVIRATARGMRWMAVGRRAGSENMRGYKHPHDDVHDEIPLNQEALGRRGPS